MKPDISEFSYGFSLTSELIDRYDIRPAGAPIFPSLQEEGQSGGGYDVEIPAIAVFLQFKLSHLMTRSSALHAAIVGMPHYRFELRPLRHSEQHNLLLELETTGNDVYYAAPEFHQAPELNAHFSAQTVAGNTWFFKPGDIGQLPDQNEHYVAFQAGASSGWTFSDPKECPRHTERLIFETNANARLRTAPRGTTVRESLQHVGDMLLDLYERVYSRRSGHVADLSSFRALRTMRDPGRYAGFVGHTLFGCQVLILAKEPSA